MRLCQSLQGFSYLLTVVNHWLSICYWLVSIPSRVLISSNESNTKEVLDYWGCQSLQGFSYLLTKLFFETRSKITHLCQSLQGFSYLLTLSLQSRYFSMLTHHFAGQIYFSLYLPITTHAKMPFSSVFMLCAADFTKYTSIMFSMSINLTIILYIMQVLLSTV